MRVSSPSRLVIPLNFKFYFRLQLLRSTIVGVVILHLLLVPGTAFVTGGARIIQQDLHPHSTELNHSLLTLGCANTICFMIYTHLTCRCVNRVMSLLLPAAFFAAQDTGFSPSAATQSIVTDQFRRTLLEMSRGIAILLLIVCVS